ncbi:MAG TPA: transglycosylase SLT domain-containing protein [Aromatoleum sp.]|uniref:lytic transglycosylase domain-containing protein n=1 Tax=Aromatoleum sp. TaxID=2307007 RepID=UPI002B49A6AC|nr:transglycosylase SLT domain-containing protein [Aromatoleum sp.]HJV25038.1 transglycosylase SLT domain-containing protein [Aromatoleum sp.]
MAKGLWAALAFALASLSPAAWAQLGDDRILAAREALRTGDRATLERLSSARDPHVLDPYVRYWRLYSLLARPEPAPAAELIEFLLYEPDSLLAERLRADWLRHMARDRDWSGFLQLYPDLREPDAELRCLQRNARLENGDMTVIAEVQDRWMELVDANSACETVFRTLALAGHITPDQLWWRIRRQTDSRNPAAARATLSWLPVSEAPALAEFERATKSPAAYLDKLPPNFSTTRIGREVALAALTRLAREDVAAARVRFDRIEERFAAEERSYLYAVLGHQGALQGSANASAWFRAAGKIPLSAEQRAWRVRAALRTEDWRGVQAAIEALPANEQALPEWTYWLGRAQAAQGRSAEAQAQFRRIAGQPNFYGLLAAEELGQTFAPPTRSGTVTADDIARAESDPGLRRALALYRLDMRTEGMREWSWALRGQDDGFLIAAARLAVRNEIYDRAINTAERTDPQANYDLRFLAPYRQIIEPQVRQQGLDLAWVYGLMRQESRFIVPARSSSGAQGLMQVMPTTGKWVAKKIGMSNYQANMLSDPDTNVLLGTSYMRLILEDLDSHPVLASAGYNAGPGRARRWREDRPLEGAIYAETIPFDETRDYVKKVMTNAVIYAAMFEARPQSLKARLGTIAPRISADR